MNTVQLLILDDINFIDQQSELIKALIVGQEVTIRSLYCDDGKFHKSIPCVILTNRLKVLDFMESSPELGHDLFTIGIDFYIGPPDTAPERHNYKFYSWGVKQQLEEYREKKSKYKKKFSNNNYSYFENI